MEIVRMRNIEDCEVIIMVWCFRKVFRRLDEEEFFIVKVFLLFVRKWILKEIFNTYL